MRLVPQIPSPAASSPDEEPSHLSPLPLFKALKARSAEHLSVKLDARQPSRFESEDEYEYDVGVIISQGTYRGMCTRSISGQIWGFTWSDQELVVSRSSLRDDP